VTFGAGQFVAVGSPAAILTSQDGLDWTPRNSGTNARLTAVAFGGHSFVAAGGGVVLQSDPIHALDIASTSAPKLTLTGPSGANYRIEATMDPDSEESWQTLTNLFSVLTPFDWVDPAGASSPQRFYRSVFHDPSEAP
jgi:hypothetical protein